MDAPDGEVAGPEETGAKDAIEEPFPSAGKNPEIRVFRGVDADQRHAIAPRANIPWWKGGHRITMEERGRQCH
jgi:hypothetical protein